jgi:hypothetical protein
MVSFAPPEGGVVVFAHPDGNIIAPRTRAAGMSGIYFDNFFIFNSL